MPLGLRKGKFRDEIRRLEIQGLQSLKTLSQNLTASFAERVGEHNFRHIAGYAWSEFSEMGWNKSASPSAAAQCLFAHEFPELRYSKTIAAPSPPALTPVGRGICS
jgi:hypothetical protein